MVIFLIRKRLIAFILTGLLGIIITNGNAQDKKKLTVVTFGNSTTAPRMNINKVYAVRLKENLAEAGIESRVINSGLGGSHSGSYKDSPDDIRTHGMDRLDTAVLRYHPDWVTINFGINDSWQNAGKKGPSRIPLNKFRQNLSVFIDRISEGTSKVILLTPNPLGRKYGGFHKTRLRLYMRVTRKLAKAKTIPLIDTWKLFRAYSRKTHTGIDELLLDGMHPNDTGHAIIANAMVKIIISSSK